MKMQNWNPYVRFARIKGNFIPQEILHDLLRAVDHRIFYCHNGKGQVDVGGKLYPFTAGTLIYMPAGTPYRYLFDEEIPFFTSCNFDFFQDYTYLSTPIPPIPSTNFHDKNILEKQILDSDDIFSHIVHLENAFQFEKKFIEISEEFVNHNLYYDVRCSTLLKDILIQIARLVEAGSQGINRQKADDILQYIHSNYHCSLTNKDIATHFNYHENYISTLILKYTGLTLHQYVLHHKMHMAVVFLQSTTMSIGEVAEKVGMPDLKHFSKCFKKIIGHSPSLFKIK